MERMKLPDKAPSLRRALASTAFALGVGLFFAGPAGAGEPRSCSENCDRRAAECLDACETKFKEDKPRVECKMQCATDRQKCEGACANP